MIPRRTAVRLLSWTAVASVVRVALPAPEPGATALPTWRLSESGWGKAGPADVRAVIESVLREMWPCFPRRRIEPFVVMRGHEGPIVLHQRNSLKEVVIKLDTQDLYWCQYVYQFAHEICHVLCGFDDDWRGNLWFEESLCEAASLFVLRRLASTWAKFPPFESWRAFAPRFRQYADDIINRRTAVPDSRMPDWWRRHRETLVRNSLDRELNGTASLMLLRMLEASPTSWEAVEWLNSRPSAEGETFDAYLTKWHHAASPRCRPFIIEVHKRFGLTPVPPP